MELVPRTRSRRIPNSRLAVVCYGRQQRGKPGCEAMVQQASTDASRRCVSRQTFINRQSALRLLAPLVEPNPRYANSLAAVPEFWRHEIGEMMVERLESTVERQTFSGP